MQDDEVNDEQLCSNYECKESLYVLDKPYSCPSNESLMNEIVHLRMELYRYQEENAEKKKVFTIEPTMYTFGKDFLCKRTIKRTASVKSLALLENSSPADDVILDDILYQCTLECPNPFFSTMEFVTQFLWLCDEVCEILSYESRLLSIKSPVYVFGDFHGNMTDLMAFAKTMWPLGMHLTPGSGQYGLELLSYLFSQKVMIPGKVFLLRGNHEVRAVNGYDAFYKNRCFLGQLKERFSQETAVLIWEKVNSVFDCLPMAATIDNAIFCVHGGIPRPLEGSDVLSIEAINRIPCPFPLSANGQAEGLTDLRQLVIDMLWSDPAHKYQEASVDSYGFCTGERGSGAVCYGQKAVAGFIAENGISHILRAHEPTQSGISIRKCATVITIFSTSRDHNCANGFCGCILVDGESIIAITHPDASL